MAKGLQVQLADSENALRIHFRRIPQADYFFIAGALALFHQAGAHPPYQRVKEAAVGLGKRKDLRLLPVLRGMLDAPDLNREWRSCIGVVKPSLTSDRMERARLQRRNPKTVRRDATQAGP